MLETIRGKGGLLRRFLHDESFLHSILAFIDQALLSLTNFLTGIILLRGAEAEQYGIFVIANSAILFAISIQNGLIVTPMSVLAPKRKPDQKQFFVSTLAGAQYLIWLPLVLVVVFLVFLGRHLNIVIPGPKIIISVAVVTLVVFLREFMRRVFFVYKMPSAVLYLDAVNATIFLGAVYLVAITSSMPAMHAIQAMGLAALLAGLVGLSLFQKRVGWTFTADLGALRDSWKHGKWALMGAIVTWLQNQGFLFLLGGLKGMGDVANVSASRLLLMPIAVMLTGILSILKPHGAAVLATSGKRQVFRLTAFFTSGTAIFALLYIAILLVMAKTVTQLVFGKEIANIDTLLLLWGIVFMFQIFRVNFSMLFQIFERFESLFYLSAIAAAISLVVGYGAIQTLGTIGSLIGIIVGELVLLVGMVLVYFGFRKRKPVI